MKCKKPNTDQDCTLTVYANGFPCQEFILPSDSGVSSVQSDVVECFIPVTDGDELTVVGQFNGTVLHGCFDLVADGTYIADKRIEGDKTGKLKFCKRKLSLDKVFDCPTPEGWTSIFDPKFAAEGVLSVKSLAEGDQDAVEAETQGLADGNPRKLPLGSLAVVVSVNQDTYDNYDNEYVSRVCGTWRNRVHRPKPDPDGAPIVGPIHPTHELAVKIFDYNVHKNRQSKHIRHFEQTRFGKKPWAKFIFYYRSQMAIQNAGCILRPDEFQELVEDDEEFVRSTEMKQMGGAKKKQTQVPVEQPKVGTDDDGMGEGVLFGANRFSTMETAPPHPRPRQQPPQLPQTTLKRRLFGQSLFHDREESPDTLFVGSAPVDAPERPRLPSSFSEGAGTVDQGDDNEMMFNGYGDIEGDEQGQDLTEPISINSSPVTSGQRVGDHGTDLSDVRKKNMNEANTNTEVTPPDPKKDDAAASAVTTRPNEAAENIAQSIEQGEAEVKEGPQTANPAFEVPKSFSDDTTPALHFDNNRTVANRQGFIERLNLAPPSTSQKNNDTITSIQAADQDPVQIKTEPIDPATMATTPSTQPNPKTTPQSLKRTHSTNPPTSAEETPSKKTRLTEMEATRARLVAEVEEKRRRNAAAKKANEERKRLREEEEREREEAMLREIEELERMNAAEDEELAALMRESEEGKE